ARVAISVHCRMMSYSTFGLCALAAIGIDVMDDRMARTFAIVAGTILFAAFAIPSGVSIDYLQVGATRAVAPLVLAACAIVVLERRRAALVLFALLLLQRGGEASSLQPTLPPHVFYPDFPGRSILRSRIVGVGT